MISGASEEELELANYRADILLLEQDNAELKKQLEEINKVIEKCGFANIEQVILNYCGLLIQQKEFTEWLENGIETVKNTEFLDERIQRAGLVAYNRALQKYKSIIGGKKDES